LETRVHYCIISFNYNKDKIIELDTDGELKETFLNYVSINSSITQELPRFTPSFKKPKLTYDQMMHATTDESELEVYDIAPNKEVCTEPIYYLKSVKKPGITDLEWWKKNKKKFPMLSKFALQFLCVPLTSAAIERAFSHAGVISKKRTHQKEAATNAKIKSKIKKNLHKIIRIFTQLLLQCCNQVRTKEEQEGFI